MRHDVAVKHIGFRWSPVHLTSTRSCQQQSIACTADADGRF